MLYATSSPSIHLAIIWVDQSKTVTVRTMQFSPKQTSPIPPFFVAVTINHQQVLHVVDVLLISSLRAFTNTLLLHAYHFIS